MDNETATTEYKKRMSQIGLLLLSLENKRFARMMEVDISSVNWTHVGDLGRVIEGLEEVDSFWRVI
jgi:hypothetical protein